MVHWNVALNDDERSGIVDGFKGCIEHCEEEDVLVI